MVWTAVPRDVFVLIERDAGARWPWEWRTGGTPEMLCSDECFWTRTELTGPWLPTRPAIQLTKTTRNLILPSISVQSFHTWQQLKRSDVAGNMWLTITLLHCFIVYNSGKKNVDNKCFIILKKCLRLITCPSFLRMDVWPTHGFYCQSFSSQLPWPRWRSLPG